MLDGEYEEVLIDKTKEKIKFSRTTPIHEDLRAKFFMLRKHLALICEQIVPSKEIKDFDDWYVFALDQYEVTGFVLTGYDESEGVMLIGKRTLASGKNLNLNSPIVKWDDDDNYDHVAELRLNIEGAIYEVDQYLFSGKRAPEKQPELPFGDVMDEIPEELNENA